MARRRRVPRKDTYYLAWHRRYDNLVRAIYYQITGETIQANPLQDASGELRMIGTTRPTPEMRDLVDDNYGVQFYTEMPWTPKER